jgi:presenilin-like A22 family membrane protease
MKDKTEHRTEEKTIMFLFWEIIFSVIIFFCGIFYAYKFYIFSGQNVDVLPKQSMVGFLGSIVLGTVTLLLVMFFLKKKEKAKKVFYKFIFIFANVYGALSILPVLLNLIIPATWSNILALLITLICMYVWFRKPTIWNHNFLMILGLAGVGGIIGLELREPALIAGLLAILAIYDFIAVYKTKHMVKMAESMIETQTIIGLIIPSNRKDFLEETPKGDTRKRFVILGGSDLAIPLMLATSFIPFGLEKVLIISAFAILGMILSFWLFYSQKAKQAIPALPAISFMSLIGCLLAIAV